MGKQRSSATPTTGGLLWTLGPGLLVAATGVGAGDLATAGLVGSHLGVGVLWAVVVGAVLKYGLNEGLARIQLASGRTLLERCVDRWGKTVAWLFLPYLIAWSFFVGRALLAACAVTAAAILPIFDDAVRAKLVFGAAHSAAALALVLAGGFVLFERIMSALIGVMFVIVVVTAGSLWPGTATVAQGLLLPSIPDAQGAGLGWTLALVGGVGGTVTVLCYGYWIREAQRDQPEHLHVSRIDLAVGYTATAIFGLAMVVIGSTLSTEGKGATLLVALADRLGQSLGAPGRWLFLAGAWCAISSSLLGVWQSVPYLFSDVFRLARGDSQTQPSAARPAYRAYLVALATVPLFGLAGSFEQAQRAYAIVGAWFMPVLAAALLLLNRRPSAFGALRTGALGTGLLVATLFFFAVMASRQLLP
ncbi:MAG: Nramp family divalent metal transporter [Proteobacteria bacterium]|nr:Nramp family divalent metal transporter [Pseudomonadota bacterium]